MRVDSCGKRDYDANGDIFIYHVMYCYLRENWCVRSNGLFFRKMAVVGVFRYDGAFVVFSILLSFLLIGKKSAEDILREVE